MRYIQMGGTRFRLTPYNVRQLRPATRQAHALEIIEALLEYVDELERRYHAATFKEDMGQ